MTTSDVSQQEQVSNSSQRAMLMQPTPAVKLSVTSQSKFVINSTGGGPIRSLPKQGQLAPYEPRPKPMANLKPSKVGDKFVPVCVLDALGGMI